MPVRPKLQPVRERRIPCIAFLIADGTAGFTGDEVFPDRESARQAWPDYRREVWAHTHRGSAPRAGELYDELTTSAEDMVRSHWNREHFPLGDVLAALEADREAVRQFRERDPKGARSIADYLDVFVAHFDVVEREARRLAAATGPCWDRGYPHRLSSGARYGDAPGIRS